MPKILKVPNIVDNILPAYIFRPNLFRAFGDNQFANLNGGPKMALVASFRNFCG
jgi:hypothetical protein